MQRRDFFRWGWTVAASGIIVPKVLPLLGERLYRPNRIVRHPPRAMIHLLDREGQVLVSKPLVSGQETVFDDLLDCEIAGIAADIPGFGRLPVPIYGLNEWQSIRVHPGDTATVTPIGLTLSD